MIVPGVEPTVSPGDGHGAKARRSTAAPGGSGRVLKTRGASAETGPPGESEPYLLGPTRSVTAGTFAVSQVKARQPSLHPPSMVARME
jgi:hypothetical protein